MAGAWMISPDVEKTPEQKEEINYLAVGEEKEFNFRGVAFIYNKTPQKPESLPEGLGVLFLNFESMTE